MAKSITIRGISETTLAELKSRAARKGQSLQEFMRLLLTDLASKPDKHELLEQIRRRVESSGVNVTPEEILRWRDEGRQAPQTQ
jgi:plasmid stability protein